MTPEERRHKELLAAIDKIKVADDKFLAKDPYEDMFAPMLWAYRHPKFFWRGLTIFGIVLFDVAMDVNRIGVITLLLKLFKQ